VVNYDPSTQVAELEVKNRFDKGDTLTFITPDREFEMVVQEAYYKGHPEALEFSSRAWNNSKKEFNANQIKPTDHAHGGGENVFVKLSQDLGSDWSTAIVRMPYKEAVSLRQRTPVAVS
jgi:hypothetical protein